MPTVSRVSSTINGAKVGQATSPPYAVTLTPILVGSYPVVAVAVDNVGGMTLSAPVTFTVSATLTTSILQRGLSGYTGVTTRISMVGAPNTVRGLDEFILNPATFRPWCVSRSSSRKAARCPMAPHSIRHAFCKQYYDDMLQLNALLKPWSKVEATDGQEPACRAVREPAVPAPTTRPPRLRSSGRLQVHLRADAGTRHPARR
jgi:hypothetical protein